MSGLVDIAIVGGSEAIASPATMRAWEAVQAISETTCRPFSIGRDGTVVGEGAAALVLEAADHAAARNARVLGRFCGAGMSSDAFHWTQPSPEGAVTAMGKALRHGDVPQGAAVLVAAHGTGTVLNDRNEARAIAQVLGSRKCPYQVIATKGAHGHLIGASLALQTVIGLKALQTGIAPPVLNYLGPDPEFDLDIVTTLARPIDANFLLANAFAFGGLNASLVFSL
jgi:nodulation protein E